MFDKYVELCCHQDRKRNENMERDTHTKDLSEKIDDLTNKRNELVFLLDEYPSDQDILDELRAVEFDLGEAKMEFAVINGGRK